MLSASDILKLLDQIPVWKTLRALPARVEALETRLAALEAAPKQADHLHSCAECGAPAKVTQVRDDANFGFAGVKRRTITCENGHAHEYRWDPNKE